MPADGVVVRGNAAVDESMVTGESMPVHKEEGSEVIGATVRLVLRKKNETKERAKRTEICNIIS